MERNTVMVWVDPDGQTCSSFEHVDVLCVASKKLASDAQGVDQAMCLRRPRDAGSTTKFQGELEQTSSPFQKTRGTLGEDLSILIEAPVRPEVLDQSATS